MGLMITLTASPTGVTTAGTIVSLTAPPGTRRYRMDEVRVRRTAGSSQRDKVAVTTDTASGTPGTYDPERTIVTYDDDLESNDVVDTAEAGSGFPHRLEDSAGELRIHIVPDDDATPNDYEITILMGRRR